MLDLIELQHILIKTQTFFEQVIRVTHVCHAFKNDDFICMYIYIYYVVCATKMFVNFRLK